MSQNIYFTSDLHLGHRAIIDHCHRPFSSVEEMDRQILENINTQAGKADRLYIVGDFCLGGKARVLAYRNQIHCGQVFLVRGNHDSLSASQYDGAGVIYKGDIADIKIDEQPITLCHYAMRRWNKARHGAYMLYGHSHGDLPDDPKLLSFDIGMDCHNFQPLSFAEVQEKMDARRAAGAGPTLHHLD